ncbi:uncharacterized protein LOC113331365 [Papaver somniferum]|uniref:uncharacterized protein LOC113331365 n=1 Tax=Papaver somniferum TaxID=3469 RepID=UPI000E6F8160|nr:uncharacterized protein LOC113331365 [Papaver somniferum]
MAGAGWICRNADNQVVMAMAAPIGIASVLIAETWALLLEVRMTTSQGWRNMWFETNSTTSLRLIKNLDMQTPWIIRNMLSEIHHHLNSIQQFKMTHIYREANQGADGLANFAIEKQFQQQGICNTFIWENTCPTFLNEIVTSDSMGRLYPREVSI